MTKDKCHDSHKAEVNGHSIEFVSVFGVRDRIGIRLDGRLLWFRLRHTRDNVVRCTRTGITTCAEASELVSFARRDSRDAIWLAQMAHENTKPTKGPQFDAGYLSAWPELA